MQSHARPQPFMTSCYCRTRNPEAGQATSRGASDGKPRDRFMASAATLMGKYSGVRRKYFVVLVAFLAAVNALTFLYHASSAVAFNVLSDITSVSLIAYST